MPIGIIINVLSIIVGGVFGAVVGNKINAGFKDNINMIFGICSMGMGIRAIALMENMPAVIFSVIAGTAIGLLIHLGGNIDKAAGSMQRGVSKMTKSGHSQLSKEEFDSLLVTVIVLFCASGTGIYGSIVSGMTGDHSILIAKSVLDFCSALIFACTLGAVVSFVAIPQFVIFLLLFFCAGVIYPLTTPSMVNDFQACGGFIMFATGFRMINIKKFPVADMIPAMIIVMPFSWLWVSFVLPLVS